METKLHRNKFTLRVNFSPMVIFTQKKTKIKIKKKVTDQGLEVTVIVKK